MWKASCMHERYVESLMKQQGQDYCNSGDKGKVETKHETVTVLLLSVYLNAPILLAWMLLPPPRLLHSNPIVFELTSRLVHSLCTAGQHILRCTAHTTVQRSSPRTRSANAARLVCSGSCWPRSVAEVRHVERYRPSRDFGW